MASSKPLVVVALLLLVTLLMVADAQPGPKIDCPSACEARCAKNDRKHEMCIKDCNICCGKCNCVPSGTGQDTRNECPCYANMVDSKNGKPKCP